MLDLTISTAAGGGGGSDIFTWISGAAASGTSAAKGVGGAAAIVFILMMAWKAKGAIAGIVAGGIAAIVFIWFVNNVGNSGVQDKVTKTVNNNGSAQIGHLDRPPEASGVRILGLDDAA